MVPIIHNIQRKSPPPRQINFDFIVVLLRILTDSRNPFSNQTAPFIDLLFDRSSVCANAVIVCKKFTEIFPDKILSFKYNNHIQYNLVAIIILEKRKIVGEFGYCNLPVNEKRIEVAKNTL